MKTRALRRLAGMLIATLALALSLVGCSNSSSSAAPSTSTASPSPTATPSNGYGGKGASSTPEGQLPNAVTVVQPCTLETLQQALNKGGYIVFACGPGPFTFKLPVKIPLGVPMQTDTTIDGRAYTTTTASGTQVVNGPVTFDGASPNFDPANEHQAFTLKPCLVSARKRFTLINTTVSNAVGSPKGQSYGVDGGVITEAPGYDASAPAAIQKTQMGCDVVVQNTTLDHAFTSNSGGAVEVDGANVTIIDSTFLDDTALVSAGAIYLELPGVADPAPQPPTITITGSLFEGNTSGEQGNDLYSAPGASTFTCAKTTFVGDQANPSVGTYPSVGIYGMYGPVSIQQSEFENADVDFSNAARHGITIADSLFQNSKVMG